MTIKQIERSYSAQNEQWIVLDALGKMGAIKDEPTFLDLGAGDGLTGSNTRALSDQGWRGVLVESDPKLFLRLIGNHNGNDKMACVLGVLVDAVATDKHRPLREQRLRPSGGGWVVGMTAWELAQIFGGRYEFVSGRTLSAEVVESLGPCLTHTRLVCLAGEPAVESAWAKHGFTELVGRTSSSVVLCRKEWAAGYETRGDSVKAASVEALKEHGIIRTWSLEEPAPVKEAVTPASPEVLADPKARMARARSFMKVSPAEAGRRGAAARARRDPGPVGS